MPEEVRFIEAGRRYLAMKQYGTARECFERYLLINPRSAEAYIGIADLYQAIGDNDAMVVALRKAHQVAPANPKLANG